MDMSLQGIGDLALTQALAVPKQLSAVTMDGIDKAATKFEGMFMTQMFEPMFQGLGTDPMFGGGHGEEVMRSFLVQEFGRLAAKTGRVGIASAVKQEMIRMQQGGGHTGGAAAYKSTPVSSSPTGKGA